VSIETDFRAALVAYAPLTALVGTTTRIAKNAVDQTAVLPIVVFSALHDLTPSLDGTTLGTQATFTVECWAETAVDAAAVADQVAAALASYNASQTSTTATVLARSSAYDGDLKLDGDVLTVEWWDV